MTREFFADEMTRLYETFNKDFNEKQCKEYYDRLQRLSDTQIHEVISTALDEISKFPTRADLVKICRNKGFFEAKVDYVGKSPFVLFICYCGGSVALERKKIEEGAAQFVCPNSKYRMPIEWSGQIRTAELELARKRREAQHLPAKERDRIQSNAYQEFVDKKNEIQRNIIDAPPMCNRKYEYLFIKNKCKVDGHGCIDMRKQKIVEDDPLLFDVDTGTAVQ
jgi:hypothetical protein